MMAIRGPWSFYGLRILLGLAEAGFFPGIILYLTYWFPPRQRARAVALFMAASPTASILGNPLSGAILQYMDGVGGLRGWQWVFLLEGIPAVVLGFVVLLYLTDRPEQADWLTPEERDWLAGQLSEEHKHRGAHHSSTLVKAMVDPRVWLLVLLYFAAATGANSTGFFLPKLIQSRFPDVGALRVLGASTVGLMGSPLGEGPFLAASGVIPGRTNLSGFWVGLLSAVPGVCGAVCMVLNGAHSDRTGERRWHVAVPAFLSAVGCAGWGPSVLLDSPALSLLCLCLAQGGVMSMVAPFWSLPTLFLSGVAAAGGIALINSVGNLGGFVGPYVIGYLKEATGHYAGGMMFLAATLCAGGLLALCVRRPQPARPR
jgi:ACS family tartrate transporter-like MFS transporter